MPFETFTPPYPPIPGRREIEPRVLSAEFGDGYEQEAGDGLNTQREVWPDVVWENLTAAEAKQITDFFEARGGKEAFLYTMPGKTVEKKYKCKSWSDETVAYDVVTVRATFRQSFDL